MSGATVLELALDACLDVVDVASGRKRQLVAAVLAGVLLLSPETYVSVASARAKIITDALTEHILQTLPGNISVPKNVADPTPPHAP